MANKQFIARMILNDSDEADVLFCEEYSIAHWSQKEITEFHEFMSSRCGDCHEYGDLPAAE